MADGRLLFTSADAVSWCGGRLDGCDKTGVYSVEADSRRCGPGSLFIAIEGEHANGHDYVIKAFESGAAGAVVSCRWHESKAARAVVEAMPKEGFLVVVDKPLSALQAVAAGYLRGVEGPPLRIGVTGSNGKTTTKELIAGVLAERYSVIKTVGNYNSEIGLPLTVFNIDNSYDYAVIEMGINRVGEMDVLAEILRPDMVVITNIGTAHIGIFKTVEKIAYEKKQAVSRFNGEGTLFLPENGPFRDFLSDGIAGRVVRYGLSVLEARYGQIRFENAGLRGWKISIEEKQIAFPLLGPHNLENAFCAIVVGLELGLNLDEIVSGLEKAEPLFGRSEVIEGPVTIIQDCYNANADSMLNSIKFADELDWSGRKRYVLGDMKELGENSRDIHVLIGRAAAESSAMQVFFFGEDSTAAYEEAVSAAGKRGASSPAFFHTDDYSLLESEVTSNIETGDLLLLKASRSMNLERLVGPVKTKFGRVGC